MLFNYDWLHAKLSSCPLQAVLADFEDASINIDDKDARRELMLVADALRLGGAILGVYPNMLAAQLVGRLLPEIGGNPNIKMLLEACDKSGPKDSALIPLNHCLHTPGGPLKVIRAVIKMCYHLAFGFPPKRFSPLPPTVLPRRTSICCFWLLSHQRLPLYGVNFDPIYHLGFVHLRFDT